MSMELEQVLPGEIERRSFEIITEELKGRRFDVGQEDIIKRVIHTTADFEYADTMTFSPDAVKCALEALRDGGNTVIVTDTNMALAGINKKVLASLAGKPTAIWRMRMWRLWRRNGRPPGRLLAWSWLRSWKNQ